LDTPGLVQGTARLEGQADGREVIQAEVVLVADMAVATDGTEPRSSLMSVLEPAALSAGSLLAAGARIGMRASRWRAARTGQALPASSVPDECCENP
jgi:hypothetical protein